jgi:glycosyltransferase involved in cell wall biosynthesis
MTKPLVSILIPVYNAGEFLRPSVESILSQTYQNLEVIIIDDGSTDGCMDTISDLKDSRMRVISQENCGKAVVLNRALKGLSGEFYAIQDADDLSYPQRIEQQVKCMHENHELAAVFTGHDLILDGRRLAPRFSAKSIEQCWQDIEQMRMPAHDPTVMFRMSMVSGLRYEPTLIVGQGWDYILRVGEHYPMMVIGECLYSYRYHFDSNTRQDFARRNQKVRDVLKFAFQRRGLNIDKYFPSGLVSSGAVMHREREDGIIPHFMESVLDLRRAGRVWESLKTATACLWLHPFDLYYYKPFCYFAAPLSLIKWYRKTKSRLNKS